MKTEMTSSERFRAALTGGDMDRMPMYELGYWPETLRRWHTEGLPEGVVPQEYFGLDRVGFFGFDGSLGLPSGVVESDGHTQLWSDGDGTFYRSSLDDYGTPAFVRATIETEEDWLKYRSRLKADAGRLPRAMPAQPVTGLETGCGTMDAFYARCKAERCFTVLTPVDPIWYALRVMGEERSLMAIAAEPEFIAMVAEDYARFNEAMLRLLLDRGYRFDAVWVFSDLCYKNGMLFSPRFYREHVLPGFARFVALCHEAGSRFIFHSDGDISKLLPLLVEAGVDCMQPLEARAGNDVVDLLPQYGGKISFMGNISADVLSTTTGAIREELTRKLPPAAASRRYIFHSDHSIPPGVSLQNYAFAVGLAKELGRY